MNVSQNAEQFHIQLAQYVPLFSSDYWPVWLVVAGLVLVGMWLVLALHAMLRFRATHKASARRGEKIYLYSKAARLWHWSSALLFLLLLVNGLVDHFSAVSTPVMKSLLTVHEVCGFLLLACWIGFVLINLIGGNGHHYIIQRQGWITRAQRRTRFYLFGVIQGESHPFPASPRSKFNPLQQVAYVSVMYDLLPLLLIIGLLSLYPTAAGDLFPGARYWLLQAHFALAIVSLFFIFGHLYLCTTGRIPDETFKCMVDGYHRHQAMMITRSDLRAWCVGPIIYRWFLRAFSAGGSYADVHRVLQQEGYTDWANSLVEYGWSKQRKETSFTQQDVDTTGNISCEQAAGETSRPLASAEDYVRFSSAGDNVKTASAGYAVQIACVGYSARIGSTSYNTHIGSPGDRGRIAITGDSARISSVGDGTHIASTGMRVRISSLGDRNWIASSGDLTQLAYFGAEAKIANCADNIHIVASGEDAVVASIGAVDSIILGPGGCAALAYHDGERMRSALAVEGKNNIQASVKYRLSEDYQFVKC